MEAAIAGRRIALLGTALIFAVTLLVFFPALHNDFVNWDDDKNFLNNENYRGLGAAELRWMWTSHHMGRYIPITWMTLGLDYEIWGMDPSGYHLTSLLWHCANAVLVYFVALALLQAVGGPIGARHAGAMIAALFFGVHPLRVESVAWITERRDVVCGFFFLLSILCYLRACRSERPARTGAYWAALASFVLAVLSKEMAVTLPAVLLILDAYPLRRRRAWAEKIPFLLIALADGGIAMFFGRQDRYALPLALLGWSERAAVSLYGIAFYLWKTLVPVHLTAFYALTPHRVDPRGLPLQASVAAVVLLAAAAMLSRKKLPSLPAATLAYGVMLLPVIGILYNGLQIAADRYTYLPCLSWAMLLGGAFVAVWNAWNSTPAAKALLIAGPGLALLVLAALTWQQVQTWRDSDTLWAHALESETSYLALTSRGAVLRERGDTLWAMDHFRRAIDMKPDYWPAHFNLGACLGAMGRWAEAAEEFRVALRLENNIRDVPDAHYALGFALLQQGDPEQASGHFREALRLRPGMQNAQEALDRAQALQPAGR